MENTYLKLLNEKNQCKEIGKSFPLEKEKLLVNYQVQIDDHFRWQKKMNLLKQ
jgi:hypothetical protein